MSCPYSARPAQLRPPSALFLNLFLILSLSTHPFSAPEIAISCFLPGSPGLTTICVDTSPCGFLVSTYPFSTGDWAPRLFSRPFSTYLSTTDGAFVQTAWRLTKACKYSATCIPLSTSSHYHIWALHLHQPLCFLLCPFFPPYLFQFFLYSHDDMFTTGVLRSLRFSPTVRIWERASVCLCYGVRSRVLFGWMNGWMGHDHDGKV